MTRHRAVRALAGFAVAASLLAACAEDDPMEDGAEAPSGQTDAEHAEHGAAGPGPNEVTMRLIAFSPAALSVPAGTTVTWRQTDAGFHTVTSGGVAQGSAGVTAEPDGTFDSGRIAKGDTFEFTFQDPGTYPYYCAIHPATMRAEIAVT